MQIGVHVCVLYSDRAHGKQFIKQFEDSCSKLENYMSSAEKKLVEEKGLIDLLVESEIFYDQQFMEAKIVANVSTLYISHVSYG